MKRLSLSLAALAFALCALPAAAQSGKLTFTANGVSFNMIIVDGGTFQMGATPEQQNPRDDEFPVHQVTLSTYAIGETEVTQELWEAVMGYNPSENKYNNQNPVERVGYDACITFIERLNQATGQEFRLPTEAEWEFAARGGNLSKGYQYSGSNDAEEVAWRGAQRPVATKKPNELGIYDMSGNVWEWVLDWYGKYTEEAQVNPMGPERGTYHMYRGGSWWAEANDPSPFRVARRFPGGAGSGTNGTGLRLAMPYESYPIWVCGVQATNMTDLTEAVAEYNDVAMERFFEGDMEVTFLPYSNTLKLRNAYLGLDDSSLYILRSTLSGGLTLQLEGDNAILAEDYMALYLRGDLRITGPGSLRLVGSRGISMGASFGGVITIDGGAQVEVDAEEYGIIDASARTTGGTTLHIEGADTRLRLRGGTSAATGVGALHLFDGLGITAPSGARLDAEQLAIVGSDGQPLAGEWLTVEQGAAGNRYDLNQDGAVDVSDVTTLVAYVLAPDGTRDADCDLNQDGAVDVSDVTTLVAYVLNPTAEPEPEPQPELLNGRKTTYTVRGVKFRMVDVAGGTFQMGATEEQGITDKDAYPVHEVTLGGYTIGETEVTQELWEAVMGTNPSGFPDDAQRPVEMVSWDDCQLFLLRLRALTGEPFRLPTEAEWEFAGRGGTLSQGTRYSGSDDLDAVAWHSGNSGGTSHPVASKQPNELGIYDMTGNVSEWCQDWYGAYTEEAQTNPKGLAEGESRISRGGNWYNEEKWGFLVLACRDYAKPTNYYRSTGLRLAR